MPRSERFGSSGALSRDLPVDRVSQDRAGARGARTRKASGRADATEHNSPGAAHCYTGGVPPCRSPAPCHKCFRNASCTNRSITCSEGSRCGDSHLLDLGTDRYPIEETKGKQAIRLASNMICLKLPRGLDEFLEIGSSESCDAVARCNRHC